MHFLDFNRTTAGSLAKVDQFQNLGTLSENGLIDDFTLQDWSSFANWVPAAPTAMPALLLACAATRRRRA